MSNWICCTNRDGGTVWLNMDLAVAVRPPNPAGRTKSRTTGVFFAGEGDPWEINETLVRGQDGYWAIADEG
jgi:hypothetical protein